MSRASRCGRWPNCRNFWMSGSSRLAEPAARRAPRPATTRAGRSPRTRSTPPWSRPPDTSRSPSTADDYVELLPARWHAVNAYGVKVNRRTYDGEELNPFRQQPSGVKDTQEPVGSPAATPTTSPGSTSAARRRLDHRVLEPAAPRRPPRSASSPGTTPARPPGPRGHRRAELADAVDSAAPPRRRRAPTRRETGDEQDATARVAARTRAAAQKLAAAQDRARPAAGNEAPAGRPDGESRWRR